uniref:DUF4283 domain-containing protein n=1 Tax=Tanacetum cinerariifolium TaxID=118510 RepID=A0A6L2J0E9_TANCI|nr:hypothetical protein [Tanacetum cinerariifolium]
MTRRSKHTPRIPLKLSDSVLTMTNNKNNQKEGVMDNENEDSVQNNMENHVVVDDESNGRSGEEDNGNKNEFCATENEFPPLSEIHKQPDGGSTKENTEVGEGSGSKNTEYERCDGEETAQDQCMRNFVHKSFANITKTNQGNADNTLSLIHVCIEEGREVVVFNEELVIAGSGKWELTLCGHFLGCRMSSSELRYNLVRMWSKVGLKDIVSQNGVFMFKFRESEGMNQVLESGPCGVGKPLTMDKTTTKLCKFGSGNFGYARVLVEIKADKELKEKVKVCYKSKDNKTIYSKFIEVEYSWKSPVCSKCNVFRHNDSTCRMRAEGSTKNGNKTKHGGKKDMSGFRGEMYGYNKTTAMGNGETVEEIRRSANKFAVLEEDEESDDHVVQKPNGIDIVNKYVLNQGQPTIEESKDWTSDMFGYFKQQWKPKR